ncbi:MAG: DUF177 domain-containing protein [Anaerolineae bacterium]|nr:DUF177 domain-containing protein [Anaerolineae bacterium]MBT7069991.1 DUF177 domain-containing protein [Anaerolineae bacterium]MBT7325689.1 DUF177 domain-containing protein [Anaerolineae bacterium]
MNTPRHPFRLNLGFFLPQSIGYRHDFPFAYEEIELGKDFLLRKFEGTVTVSRMPQGLLLQGLFEGDFELECVRCLKPYQHRLHSELTELYVFNRRDASDDDLILPDNAQVDLDEFIREDAEVDIPFHPICKEDCEGLCQVCGTDLNLGDCGHDELPPEEPDDSISPFAGLKDLR